jgi:hypothetical protein
MIELAPEEREAWAATMREPHMQRGLEWIKETLRPKQTADPHDRLNPNLVVLKALRAEKYEAHQEVYTLIEGLFDLYKPNPIHESLDSWTLETTEDA